MEELLEKLEIKISYQENAIDELNEVIIELRKEIGVMQNHISKLEKKVEDLIEENGDGERENRRPPHY